MARQQWEYEQQRNGAQQPDPNLPWSSVQGFQPGTRKPHPQQIVECPVCREGVKYEELGPHVHQVHSQWRQQTSTPQPPQAPVYASAPAPEAAPAPAPQTPWVDRPGVIGAGSADSFREHLAAHMAQATSPQGFVAPSAPQEDMGAAVSDGYSVTDVDMLDGLRALINSRSRENYSDTPDFIMAQFLLECLTAFESAVRARDVYYSGN